MVVQKLPNGVKQERLGYRDLSYSQWHRTLDPSLIATDVDFVEFCGRCKKPTAIIETARDTEVPRDMAKKRVGLQVEIAKTANLPLFLVYYYVSGEDQISRLRVKQIYPERGEEIAMTPGDYESFLLDLRRLNPDHGSCRVRFY